jgi:hypothetical protein
MFTLNLDQYTNLFVGRIWADLISLRVIKSSINDKSYANFASEASKDGITIQAQQPTLNQGLIDYEGTKAFISMMRNVNDYIDKMVSIQLFKKKQIKFPEGTTQEKAVVFLNEQIEKTLFEYCQKTRENLPTKLKHFSGLSPEFTKYITTYNLLRNCYEHQKAISQRGIQIPIQKMQFSAGGEVIKKLPIVLKGPSTISMVFTQKTIHIKKGQAAVLSYEDIESTALYLTMNVPKQITQSVITTTKTDK